MLPHNDIICQHCTEDTEQSSSTEHKAIIIFSISNAVYSSLWHECKNERVGEGKRKGKRK